MKKSFLVMVVLMQSLIANGYYEVVNVASDDFLFVRSKPSNKSNLVGKFPPYEYDIEMQRCEPNSNWCLVMQYENDELAGWVNKKYLNRQSGAIGGSHSGLNGKVKNVASNDVLYLRQYPTSNAKKMGSLKHDAQGFSVMAVRDKWYFIKDSSRNIQGWTYSQFIDTY